METREVVKPKENYDLYWKEREVREPEKEKGIVRDMSSRIKKIRTEYALEYVKQSAKNKKKRDITEHNKKEQIKVNFEKIKNVPNILSVSENKSMIKKIKQRLKERRQKVQECASMLYSRSRSMNDAYKRNLRYMEKRENIPTVFGLLSTTTYSELNNIAPQHVRQMVINRIVDCVRIGHAYLIFSINFTHEEKERIKEMLKNYCSESSMRKLYGVSKNELYTAEGLVKLNAINIDGHLFFKIPETK